MDPQARPFASGGVCLGVQTDTDPHVGYDWKTRANFSRHVDMSQFSGQGFGIVAEFLRAPPVEQ